MAVTQVILADPVKPRSRRHEFAITALAFLALVQFSFHVFMGRRVDPGRGSDCDSDGASLARCAETRLFRDWQAAAERERSEQWLEPLAMPHEGDSEFDHFWNAIDTSDHATPNITAPEARPSAEDAAVISDRALQVLTPGGLADVDNATSSDAHPSAESTVTSGLEHAALANETDAEDVDLALDNRTANTTQLISDETFEVNELHWDDVAAWSSASTTTQFRGSRGAIVVAHASDLNKPQWAGKKPSVACITMVTSGPNASRQLKELVTSFKAQDYKGPKQLVLVHHRYDKDAQKLAWGATRNANRSPGAPVKAVAAMVKAGEQDTVAYRYGAWSAQADVIVRYDLQASHHPSRISTQIKALALAKRPVSRLPSVHSPQEAGETSLVGEKVWMEKYWQPLLTDESNILLHDSTAHIVHVDVPNLLVY